MSLELYTVKLKDIFTKKYEIERNANIVKMVPTRCNFLYEKKFGWTKFQHLITQHYPHWTGCGVCLEDLLKIDPFTVTSDDKIVFEGSNATLIKTLF